MEIRRPTISLSVSGTEFPCNSVTLSTSINSISRAIVNIHPNEAVGKVFNVGPSLLFESAATFQRLIYERISDNPECILTLTDGNGGSLTFHGYAANPTIIFGVAGQYSLSLSILHPDSMFSNFVGSSYLPVDSYFNREKQNDSSSVFANLVANGIENTTTIAERINQLITAAKNNRKSIGEGGKIGIVNQQLFQQSTSIFDQQIEPLLTRSATSSSIPSADMMTAASSKAITNALAMSIFTGNDFLATLLNDIVPSFRQVYINNFEVFNSGIMEENFLEDSGEEMNIDFTRANISCGSSVQNNLSRVVVMGPTLGENYFDETQFNSQLDRAIGMYPATPGIIGKVQQIYAPEWANFQDLDLAEVDTEGRNAESGDDKSAEEARQQFIKRREAQLKNLTKMSEYLDKWAEKEWRKYVLVSSNASINMPLDLSVRSGLRYTVKSNPKKQFGWESGEVEFSGYLSGITHTITIENQAANASTKLDFNYVQMPGFDINNS